MTWHHQTTLSEFPREDIMDPPPDTHVFTKEVADALAPLYGRSVWPASEVVQGSWLLVQFSLVVPRDAEPVSSRILTLPMLVTVVGMDVFDMAMVLYCTQAWKAPGRTPATRPRLRATKDEPRIIRLIDWDDALYTLGHWPSRPGWRDIRRAWQSAPYFRELPKHKPDSPSLSDESRAPATLSTNLNLV